MLTILSLLLGLNTTTYALNCQDFEATQTDDGYTMFEVVNEEPVLSAKLREQLIRKSVSAFYGSSYNSEMRLQEVDALAEGVAVTEVKDLNGKLYNEVNVGFGGGNSISYYYVHNTLELAPIAVIDSSDCMEQGTDVGFPIDSDPLNPSLAIVSCEATDKRSPISSLQIELPVSGNIITDASAIVVGKLNTKHSAYTTFEADFKQVHEISPRIVNSNLRLGMHISNEVEKDNGIKFLVEHIISVNGTNSKVKTLIYPMVTGGRWKEPKEETATLNCIVPAVSDVIYQRKIIY
jgi:hypothetical protein